MRTSRKKLEVREKQSRLGEGGFCVVLRGFPPLLFFGQSELLSRCICAKVNLRAVCDSKFERKITRIG